MKRGGFVSLVSDGTNYSSSKSIFLYTMKTMNKAFFLLLLTLYWGCAEPLHPIEIANEHDASIGTRSYGVEDNREDRDSLVQISQTPIDFFSEMSFSEWTRIRGVENRFSACNVSNEILETKTTYALAKSLLHYPLNYLIFVYDNPQEAIQLVMDKSKLHQAFVQRNDAAQVISELFAGLLLDMSIEKSSFDDNYAVLSYMNEMFLEYFICSGIIPGIFTGDSSIVLERAAREKLSLRESEQEVFSQISKYPLIEIINRINELKDEPISVTDTSPIRLSTVTIYTFFKQSLTGYHFDEMSSTELVNLTNALLTQHPNAIMRGSATNKYNCHSYAWYNNSIYNNIWLYASINGNNQLSKYWTNDLYVSCTQSSAEKVYYPSGDHSAIVLSNGKYLSKWGAGPLMEHDYDDCPYNSSNLQYYAERTTPLLHFTTISGDSPIFINQSSTYSFNTNYNMSFTVQMEYNESNDPLPCTLSQISTGSYSLTCYDPGYYVMIVEGYRNGNCIARTTKDIIAWGVY